MTDKWAQWLLTRRDGDSATLRAQHAIVLDYRAEIDVPADPIADWEALKHTAPNPLVPTFGEVIAAVLTDRERDRLDEYMTVLASAGTPTRRTMATAYLTARRGANSVGA